MHLGQITWSCVIVDDSFPVLSKIGQTIDCRGLCHFATIPVRLPPHHWLSNQHWRCKFYLMADWIVGSLNEIFFETGKITLVAQSVEWWTCDWKGTGLNPIFLRNEGLWTFINSFWCSLLCTNKRQRLELISYWEPKFIVTVWETVAPPSFICLSVCPSVCMFVCSAFTAFISFSMGRILMKLGGSVGI